MNKNLVIARKKSERFLSWFYNSFITYILEERKKGREREVMSILESYRREVGHLMGGNALDLEFSKPKIDEEARVEAKEIAGRYRGSVRIANGLFYTDEELEKTWHELLKVKLP